MPASAEVRALVLAISYDGAENTELRLANTLVDGRAIARSLRQAGLTDVRLVEEPDERRWEQELAGFIARLAPADIALVYYAGHAIQVSGRNYFLTADGTALIDVEQVMPRLTERARGTVMIIDACRNNPFQRNAPSQTVRIDRPESDTRDIATVSIPELQASHRGLSQLGNLRGLSAVVLFSTEPGNVAEDGTPGAGSPFANVAATELRRRQSLDTAFRRIAVAVNRSTQGRQSPWRQGDLPFDVYVAGMQSFPVP
ncbi:MAG: caspase family protein [Sphingomonas sp.]|nr:caspase family protein [Sphingomonas sp.]